MKTVVLLAFLALPLWAQDPGVPLGPALTAQEFDAYVTGKTLTWSLGAKVWGTEEYLANRRVQWSSAPGECEVGQWHAEGDQICFAYEGNATLACWIFRAGPVGLSADLQGPEAPLRLNETARSDQGLSCPGPDLGV